MRNMLKKYFMGTFIIATLSGIGATSMASDQVLCVPQENVAVYDDTMTLIVTLADRFEEVKVFQSWLPFSQDFRKVVFFNGRLVTFIKIQLANQDEEDAEESIGWVREVDVKAKSDCKEYKKPQVTAPAIDDEVPATPEDGTNLKGLADPNCCHFPLATTAKASYLEGAGMFGADRSKGKRKHAACDLYHRNAEPVLSVASGKIVRDRYYFYQGTYAIEVEHQGGFIVRYGEISGKRPPKTKGGTDVAAGDVVGYIKRVNSNCCSPMLHFELFRGNGKGPLTTKANRGYQRRSDLLNPTKYLQLWEGRGK